MGDLQLELSRAPGPNRIRIVGLALSQALDLDLDLDRDLARAFDHDIAGALERGLVRTLELTGTVSLLLSDQSIPGSLSAAMFADLFLAAALALEQRAGHIPPIPAGIALVRRKAK